MWRSAGFLLGLLFLAASPSAVLLAGSPPTVEEVTSNLVCTCGCDNMIVRSCTCGAAEQIRADVGNLIAQGLTKEQIWARYVAQYGQKVLASPTTRGFDLAAWLLPFVATFLAGGLLILLLRRWAALARLPTASPPALQAPQQSNLLDRLQRELRDFDR
ncbi:MAG: cytochrome c-type biogenesis protein CcmH [Terriglobia bacterium]